jgi:hypothetical protein
MARRLDRGSYDGGRHDHFMYCGDCMCLNCSSSSGGLILHEGEERILPNVLNGKRAFIYLLREFVTDDFSCLVEISRRIYILPG